jgi:endoplasmic reticulum junction formation protein lunapark
LFRRLYIVRYLLTTWYNYRIANATDNLDALYKERDDTIEKLKLATKYNSTQKLLEKYGVSKPVTEKPKGEPKEKSPPTKDRRASGGRINIEPPPTANIPRRQVFQSSTEIQAHPQPFPPLQGNSPATSHPGSPGSVQPRQPTIDEMAEFAPNAYDNTIQYAPVESSQEPRWYDRLVNALLGEDETRPDRRLALICTKCRLVNGLAPPGARTLEEVGKWKCSSCGSWNGVEPPASKHTTPSHSRHVSVSEVNADELSKKTKSSSVDDENSDGFESVGSS